MFHVSHLVHRSLILSHMQCFYLEKRKKEYSKKVFNKIVFGVQVLYMYSFLAVYFDVIIDSYPSDLGRYLH